MSYTVWQRLVIFFTVRNAAHLCLLWLCLSIIIVPASAQETWDKDAEEEEGFPAFGDGSPYWEKYSESMRKSKVLRRYYEFYRTRMDENGNIPLSTWEYERETQLQIDRTDAEQRKKSGSLSRDPSTALRWRSIGPAGISIIFPAQWVRNSGRVRGLAVHPTNPDIAYIGAAAGGVWKTDNGGTTWQDVGQAMESLTFGALAIDPANPNIVYAGAGEHTAESTPHIFNGRGLFKSTDAGATWTLMNTFGGATHFSSVRIHPTNSNLIIASLGSGYSYLGSPGNEGIWRSTDAGQTWTRVLNIAKASDVLFHPNPSSQIVYAGTGGTQPGVWISSDNGVTWSRSSNGLPSDIGRVQLAISQQNPAIVYAFAYRTIGASVLYKSVNGGADWTQLQSLPGTQSWYNLLLGLNPANDNEVYIGEVELWRSLDGGATINRVGGVGFQQDLHLDFHIMAFAPSNPTVRYIGCDGGIHRSVNGGTTWQELNDLPTLQFYRMSSHPTDSLQLFGGTQDNGNFRTLSGGSEGTWQQAFVADGMESMYDKFNPTIVYSSYQWGSILRSFQGGAFGTHQPISPGPSNNPAVAPWTSPMFQHPTNEGWIYVATRQLYRSTNRGTTWTSLTSDLGLIPCADQNQNNPNHIIMSLQTGNAVIISTDGGTTWATRTPPGGGQITRVVCHPGETHTMFVVRTGFIEGNKLWRTTNLGLTWTNISGDLPNVPQSDLFVDQLRSNEMYIANDLGVFKTSNSGVNWHRQNDGMPIVPAMDFSYFASGNVRKLRVATHGRSAYEADLPRRTSATDVTSIFFNPAEVNTLGDTATITLTNFNTVSMSVTGFALPPGQTFRVIAPPSLPLNLAPNQSASWRIAFAPTTRGNLLDTLTINTTDAMMPVFRIPLSGRGLQIAPARAGWIYAVGNTNEVYRINPSSGAATRLFTSTPESALEGVVIRPGNRELIGFTSNSFPLRLHRLSSESDDALRGITVPLTNVRALAFAPDGTLYAFNNSGLGSSAVTHIYNVNLSSGDTTLVSTTPATGILRAAAFTPTGELRLAARSGSESRLYRVTVNTGAISLLPTLLPEDPASMSASPLGSTLYALSNAAGTPNGFYRYDATTGAATLLGSTGISGLRGIAVRTDSIGVLSTRNVLLERPTAFGLEQNYPNPFNPSTGIRYQVSGVSDVRLEVFDMLGRKVSTLVNERQAAGNYTATFNAAGFASGVYFYRLQAGSFIATKKMLLLK
jgi:photosystem II stability/assembly factor-like uncharacterized protein